MRSLKIFYIVAFSLLTIYLVAEYNKPTSVAWKPTLSYQDKIPFGTYILYHELHTLFDNAELTGTNRTFYDQFHDTSAGKSNYIIIANTVNIGKYDFKEMVKYMQNGNSIFIATNGFMQMGIKPNMFADTLKIGISFAPLIGKNTENLNFTNKKLQREGGYHFDRGVASQYFERFDTTRAVVLSRNESGKATLLCYKFGKGNLFLCADPELFTNYSILKPDGAEFAAKTLSYMPVQPIIYWDHLQNHDIPEDESPVRVFLNTPNLKWAYYIALFGMVGFVLYEMKRRQRIIPVIPPLANSTVDFVSVVGRVYYEQHNNANIAQKKVMYFLEHLRNTYYLKTNKFDKEFIERISQKTGVDYALAEELVVHINYLTGQSVSDKELIKLNQLIEQFYTKSR